MYAVSNSFQEAMKKPVQQHKLGGSLLVNGNTQFFTEANIQKGSFRISNQCSGNENVEIGTVYTAELTAVFLDLGLQRYVMNGAIITPHLDLLTENGYESVPLGVFNITEANWTTFGIEVTAYDNMSKFDRTIRLNSDQYTLSIYGYLSVASAACGVGLAQTENQIQALPNGNRILPLYPDNDMETWRDLIAWCAQTTGTFATINREGRLVLCSYGTTPVDTIDDSHRFTGAKFSDFETRYTGMSCVNIRDSTTTYYHVDPDDGLTYNLGSNPLLQIGEDDYLAVERTEVLNALAVIRYVPMEVSMIGTPAYDLGDVLVFTDGAADENKLYCVTQFEWTFGGTYLVRGVGQNPSLASARSKTDKNIAGLINREKEDEICYYDYINESSYHIADGRRQKIISIRYATVKSTHVDFHAEVKYRLSTNTGKAVLRVTYMFDNVEWADYHPVETEEDGTHLLHLMLTWRNNGAVTSELAVYLELDGGEVWIERNDAHAYLTGMGLVGDEAWDGTIKIEQKIIRLDFGSIHNSFSSDVDCTVRRPERGGMTQGFSRMSFFGMMLKPMAEAIETASLHRFSVSYSDNDVVKSNVITSGNLWVVEDPNEEGLVITPDCAVTDVLEVSSHFTANSGSVSFLVSFDSGDTWYMYASGWHQHESGDGMSGSVMKAILEEEWAVMITNGTIMLEAILEGEATLEDISITTEVY